MKLMKLTEQLYVSPQIVVGDFAAIQAAGVRAIICNRPDGEGSDQPGFREMEQAAQACGLEIRYQPVTPGQASDREAEQFDRLVQELPMPVRQ